MLVTLIKLKLNIKTNLRKNYTYEEYVSWSHHIERTINPNRDISKAEYIGFINAETDTLIVPLCELWVTLKKYDEYGPSITASYIINVEDTFEDKDDYLTHALAIFHSRDNIIKTIIGDVTKNALLDIFSMEQVLEELDKELLKEINQKIMKNILDRCDNGNIQG